MKKGKTLTKNFPLRIINPKVYPVLEKAAKDRPGICSVNTLINSVLEDFVKKVEIKRIISK